MNVKTPKASAATASLAATIPVKPFKRAKAKNKSRTKSR